MKQLVPDTEIFEEFLHPALFWGIFFCNLVQARGARRSMRGEGQRRSDRGVKELRAGDMKEREGSEGAQGRS